jgi:hypothetical protein
MSGNTDISKIWPHLGPIVDPPPGFNILRWKIFEHLEEDQKFEVLDRELKAQIRMTEFQIKEMQESIETLQMMSRMMKRNK